MKENVTEKLTAKDDKAACAFADEIIAQSRETDVWYEHFGDFAALLDNPKSLVRNRAINILAAIVRRDKENQFDGILDEFLSHITDEKPITARLLVGVGHELVSVQRGNILEPFGAAVLPCQGEGILGLVDDDYPLAVVRCAHVHIHKALGTAHHLISETHAYAHIKGTCAAAFAVLVEK